MKVPASQFDRVLASREPPQLNPELAQDYLLRASMESGFVRTDFNMDDPRIGYPPNPAQEARNRALRCAIVSAFDWQQRNEVFYSGLGRVFPGVIVPSMPEFDAGENMPYVERDLDTARSLLKSGAWNAGNLPELEYGFTASVTERQMFEQFRNFLVEIGYPAEKIRPVTFASYGDYARAFVNREVMLITNAWSMDYPDTQNTLQLYFGPNASPGANNSNFNNAEFNRLYRAAESMPLSPMRTSLFRKLNQIVMDECVTISGLSRRLVLLWSKRFAMLPDRDFVGGYFIRFVAPAAADTQAP